MVSKSAVVAGHLCLDIFPGLGHLPPGGFKKLLQETHLLSVGPVVIATGGPVSNTGLALHKLGIPTRLVATVGADLFGQAVREIVQSYALELAEDLRIDPEVNTAYTIVISPPGEDRIFMGHPGASDTFGAGDIDYERVAQADLFHFGYPPVMRRMYSDNGAELVEIFRRVKAAGGGKLLTSLDMCFPDPRKPGGKVNWRTILSGALPYVDIFLPSFDELMFMLHKREFKPFLHLRQTDALLKMMTPELLHRLSGELLEMGVKVAGIKLGGRGLYLRTASRKALEPLASCLDVEGWSGRELWTACFRVQVAGTTGAGDATIAGFLSGILRNLSPAETMKMAVAVGACDVEAVDALSGIQSWEATRQRVEDGWRQYELKLEAPGWKRDSESGLWSKPPEESNSQIKRRQFGRTGKLRID